MAFTISLIIIVFLALVQTIIPFLVNRAVIFGVTVPEQMMKNKELTLFKKQYTIISLVISLLLMGIFIFWRLTANPAEDQIVFVSLYIEFAIILISFALYFYFHRRTMQLKRSNKWTENLKQVKVTDLSVREQDEMLPWYIYLFPILVTIGLIGYSITQYDVMPDQMPTHWGPTGEADAFTQKTPLSALQLPLVLLVLQLMILGIQTATKISGIKLSATNLNASKKRQLTLRKYSSWFLFLMVLLITMLFGYFQLTTIHPELFKGLQMMMPFAFLIVVLMGTLGFALKVGRSDKEDVAAIDGNITSTDEDRYWKGGLFYFNKNDPSIFVEKRFGVGWTVNCANPIAYLIVVVPIVVVALISFL